MKASNGPTNIPGRPGTQSGVWRNPAGVAPDHLQCTHFGRFFAIFCHFPTLVVPHWNPGGAKALSQSAIHFPKGARGTGTGGPNIEIWLGQEVPPFWARQLHDFWDDVRVPHSSLRATFESGRNALPALDTPVFTNCENADSKLREEPPKTVTFYENLGRSCNEMTLSEIGPAHGRRRRLPPQLAWDVQGFPRPRRSHDS